MAATVQSEMAGPSLSPGHLIPAHGAGRVDALAAGLAPQWRLVASADSTERTRHGGRGFQGRWAFMAHLLTTCPLTSAVDCADETAEAPATEEQAAARWAVALTWDGDWLTGDRHEVIATALATAVVEDTLAGLVRRFATGERLPSAGAVARPDLPWPPEARWSVLAMLLEQDFPGRAAEEMLLDLTFGVGAVLAHQSRVAADGAQETALNVVEQRFYALVEQARAIGFARQGWVTWRAGRTLREAAEEHWDETTRSFQSGFVEVEHAGWHAFFGEVLPDLTLPDPLPGGSTASPIS